MERQAERERLVKLLMQKGFGKEGATIAADHLLANGVIVPPVMVGQKVWVVSKFADVALEGEIVGLRYNGFTTPQEWIEYKYEHPMFGEQAALNRIDLCLGKKLFLTREAAENVLKGGPE